MVLSIARAPPWPAAQRLCHRDLLWWHSRIALTTRRANGRYDRLHRASPRRLQKRHGDASGCGPRQAQQALPELTPSRSFSFHYWKPAVHRLFLRRLFPFPLAARVTHRVRAARARHRIRRATRVRRAIAVPPRPALPVRIGPPPCFPGRPHSARRH